MMQGSCVDKTFRIFRRNFEVKFFILRMKNCPGKWGIGHPIFLRPVFSECGVRFLSLTALPFTTPWSQELYYTCWLACVPSGFNTCCCNQMVLLDCIVSTCILLILKTFRKQSKQFKWHIYMPLKLRGTHSFL